MTEVDTKTGQEPSIYLLRKGIFTPLKVEWEIARLLKVLQCANTREH